MVVETLESLKVSHPEIDMTHFAGLLNPVQEKLTQYKVLHTYKNFIVNDYKSPLAKAIVRLAKLRNNKVGKITKENSVYRITHMLLDLKEEFFGQRYIKGSRSELLNAAWDIATCEVETNPTYRYVLQWLIFKIYNFIELGLWPPSKMVLTLVVHRVLAEAIAPIQ